MSYAPNTSPMYEHTQKAIIGKNNWIIFLSAMVLLSCMIIDQCWSYALSWSLQKADGPPATLSKPTHKFNPTFAFPSNSSSEDTSY